jgi:serine phosphatase RsbU (regulator of sigma subunit)
MSSKWRHVYNKVCSRLLPQIRGLQIDSFYRPCQAIGGDYLTSSDRTDNLDSVSDVSGHGVQAALVNMLMKAIFQDTAPVEDPAHLFAEMNARLTDFPGGHLRCCSSPVR